MPHYAGIQQGSIVGSCGRRQGVRCAGLCPPLTATTGRSHQTPTHSDFKRGVTVHPDAVKSMPNIPQHWNVTGRPDVWYEFLHPGAFKMDDAPRSDFNTILSSGAAHIFSVSTTGQNTDRSQFADVILCPIVSFSTHLERMTLVCPGAAQGIIKNAAGNSQMLTANGVSITLALPTKESPCKVLG